MKDHSLPGSVERRARLAGHVAALSARAGRTFIDASDLAQLRRQLVDEQLDEACQVLRARALSSGWSRAELNRVIRQWAARADDLLMLDLMARRARIVVAAGSGE